MPVRVRLADLLAGLSIAIDLGFGLQPESAMRQCLVGTRLARAHGLGDTEVRDSFFASLLLHVGCPGFSHETATLFGNELVLTRAVARTNLADPADYEATLIPEATRGLSPGARRQRHRASRRRRAGVRRSLRHGELRDRQERRGSDRDRCDRRARAVRGRRVVERRRRPAGTSRGRDRPCCSRRAPRG